MEIFCNNIDMLSIFKYTERGTDIRNKKKPHIAAF